MTSDDVLYRFLASEHYELQVYASVTVKALGVISFHVMAEIWKHLKDTLSFTSFLVC